jgi:hypothetical protein
VDVDTDPDPHPRRATRTAGLGNVWGHAQHHRAGMTSP